MTMRWQCCQMNHRIGGTIPMFMQGSYRKREKKGKALSDGALLDLSFGCKMDLFYCEK